MEDVEETEKALLSRVRGIDPENAQEVVSTIMSRLTGEQIKQYIAGTHDDMRSLIENMKTSMKLKSKAPDPVQKLAHTKHEKRQSSSKPIAGSSNAMRYPQSRPEPRNVPCNYVRDGSSGWWPLGILEMEIREILIAARPFSVLQVDLPNNYYWWYKKPLHTDGSFRVNHRGILQWDGIIERDGMLYSLSSLHTVVTLPDSSGNLWVCLLEDIPLNQYQRDGDGADQIYITFHPTSRLTEGDVWSYFSHYGIVTYVHIPVVNNCCMFGYVKFLHRQTVNLLLSKRVPGVPHLINGAKVLAKRYKPMAERIPNEGGNVIQLLHASDGQKEETVPEHNIPCSGENERCPHFLYEIITSTGAGNICAVCRKLLSQIMKLVRTREKCVNCEEVLNLVTTSVRKGESCARCRQLLRQIVEFSQREG